MGMNNAYNLRIMREQLDLPLILDVGVGTASDAALAMELGCDAVLRASAISRAEDPVAMARAIALAVDAGHTAPGTRGGSRSVSMRPRSQPPHEGAAEFVHPSDPAQPIAEV